ncbi:enoyl-CoA hydratase/isomerase family protein [soil metagenome]
MPNDTPTPVSSTVFEERSSNNGYRIGIIRLNEPRKLNALSLVMIDAMRSQLEAWERDSGIAMIILEAAGEKAFCAGGDVRSLYDSVKLGPKESAERYARELFEREYELDYLLHTCSKPILAWGHGLVMGGGMGLLVGCSHRVVTAASRLSMPEIGIGLFPDVGASWFLSRVPGRLGLMLGFTAAPLDAADALFAGLADYRLDHADKDAVIAALSAVDWTGDRRLDDRSIDAVLRPLVKHDGPGPLVRNFDALREACGRPDLIGVVDALNALGGNGDEWLDAALKRMANACPTTLWLTWSLQKRTAQRSLDQVFGIECLLASRRVLDDQFIEGIRAVLIDKDGKPQWNETLGPDMPAWITSFFSALPPHAGLPLAAFAATRVGPAFKTAY